MSKPAIDKVSFGKRINQWRVNPRMWVNDIFGDNIKLSNQQGDTLDDLGEIIYAKIKKSLGRELTPKEQTNSEYIGLDVSSGMGSGKDFLASILMFYFLHVFPEEQGQSPHGLATANTAKQLSNVLWRQAAAIPAMSKKMDPNDPNSKTILEEHFVCQSEKIYRKEKGGRTFFFEAVTINKNASGDEQAAALTGRHAPYMLMILDEAAGLPEPVFTNLEGTLTGRVNLLFMIYNPIKSRGYAVNARKSKSWKSITWNTEETFFDNPSLDIPLQERNRDLLERYSRESNVYRIRVLGLPPIAEQDVFIPWDWVQDAVERDLTPAKDDPIIMGVDPGAGGDNSVVVIRQGPRILNITRFNTADPNIFADKTIEVWHKFEPVIINIDSIGIGWGAAGILQRLNYKVNYVDVRRTARNRDEYDTVRDELWNTLKDQFRDSTISIPNDQELIDQLGSIKVKDYDKKGRMRIPSKKDMRKSDSVGGSPDEADAICLTYAIPDDRLKRLTRIDPDEEREKEAQRRRRNAAKNRVTGY